MLYKDSTSITLEKLQAVHWGFVVDSRVRLIVELSQKSDEWKATLKDCLRHVNDNARIKIALEKIRML